MVAHRRSIGNRGKRSPARCGCRPTAPNRGRSRSGWTARATPTPYFQQNQPFPFPDALQEFSIQTSNYSAAQGNSAGAVVNAVTRSGTNDFHGGAFGYLRDRKFNAKNFFLPEKDFLKRKQYGGFAGGPIVRNKMFFFAGWQGTTIQNVGGTLVQFAADDRRARRQLRHLRTACNRAITDPLAAAVPRQPDSGRRGSIRPSVNVLKFMPVGPGNGDGALVQVPRRIGQDDNQIVGKVDQQLNQTNQVSVRYFFDHFTNDPTYTEGNLLSYRNPTLQSRHAHPEHRRIVDSGRCRPRR